MDVYKMYVYAILIVLLLLAILRNPYSAPIITPFIIILGSFIYDSVQKNEIYSW